MKYFKELIASTIEPNKESLWLHNGRLKYFGSKGWETLTARLFDAGFLYNAAIAEPEAQFVDKNNLKKLEDAVKNKDIIYLSVKVNEEFSFKVMVVFTGYNTASKEMSFSASDFYNHYKLTVNTDTGKVSMEQSSVGPSTLSENNVPVNYVFNVTNTLEEKKLNKQLAADILFDKVEAVRVKGTLDGITYDTIGVYNDGYITALQKNEYIVFNVSFEDGSITAETITKVNKSLPYVEIMIGDSEEVKQFNSENLPNGEFFIHSGYGYGVGTYQDGIGGFAHITNAYGNELFYIINSDNSIMPDRDYVKPNEPYTLILNESDINSALDEVTSSALKKAGEIVVNTQVGPITYTRTTDSTPNMVYFTDSKKDGSTVLLTYTDSNKRLTFAPVEPKKAEAVEDAVDMNDIVSKYNALLASLRKAGILSNN